MEKMKILWVCNVPIPRIAADMNVNAPNICGWLTGFANSIEKIAPEKFEYPEQKLELERLLADSSESE